mmetsp:Transcript_12722/g.32565  ORF Transcript_12722/g.32565 Transcript_12722/m.32565 type:complete len:173 (+) Transcript_12722:3635-4153(+)
MRISRINPSSWSEITLASLDSSRDPNVDDDAGRGSFCTPRETNDLREGCVIPLDPSAEVAPRSNGTPLSNSGGEPNAPASPRVAMLYNQNGQAEASSHVNSRALGWTPVPRQVPPGVDKWQSNGSPIRVGTSQRTHPSVCLASLFGLAPFTVCPHVLEQTIHHPPLPTMQQA